MSAYQHRHRILCAYTTTPRQKDPSDIFGENESHNGVNLVHYLTLTECKVQTFLIIQ